MVAKKAITDLAISLAKNDLPGLVSSLTSNASSNVIGKLGRKINAKGAVREGRGLNLFISNEDMDDIIKIVESLEKSSISIDGATETIGNQMKKQEGGFFRPMMAPIATSLIAIMASSLIQPVASSLINAITGKGVRRAGKRQDVEILSLLALPLMMKVLGKEVMDTNF